MAVKLEESRVKQAVDSLLEMFASGNLPQAVARTFINARADMAGLAISGAWATGC
ncbi:Uncharacterized [Moorella glycerini]|uniref:Uncharacterized protein n=1 Tax=Neomoorella stamsii TaxID=1266720 RepID=A0A9X7J078_9FIRM|nr:MULTISPECIES: hypothetical protein [Moorella]PRR69214.1 hypothetical protein MOST_30940 [Moorella stamsii]CEP67958.1 Uncharacterized [Moorella glycerini]